MTENQHNNPDHTKPIGEETFDPRDLVNKGGYSKDPQEIIGNPAVTPQTLGDRNDEGVGMNRGDNQNSN